MFAIVVEGGRRACFGAAGATLGRSTMNDFVLPHPDVSRHHAQVVALGPEQYRIVDRGSAHGTWIGGSKFVEHEYRQGERIQIGPFVLTIESGAAADPVEQRLLAAITARQDATSRLVYADWLEEHGEHARAEFLRLQESLVVTPDIAQAARLRLLAASTEISWRHAVARPAVEGCAARFNFACPKEWGSFTPTDEPDVRHCDGCNEHVYYCPTLASAWVHVAQGRCVAVDVIPRRVEGDLGDTPARAPRIAGMIPMPPMPDFDER